MSAGRKNNITQKDYNTPPKYVNAITEFFGEVDLNPLNNITYEEALAIYNDLEIIESTGVWPNNSIPPWAQQYYKYIGQEHSSAAISVGWKAVARVLKNQCVNVNTVI